MTDFTERFSNRVRDYVRYRPHYPPAALALLRDQCHLESDDPVADIGSGTGFLAELFLENGNPVYGVEPNDAMREAGEAYLARFPAFHSVAATAEATTLPDGSVKLVTAGQAFHWFDVPAARREFARILRPDGWCALVWNTRLLDASPFLVGYEALLQAHATDYREVTHQDDSSHAALARFFDAGTLREATFPNQQQFDWEGLAGRVFSSSYTPAPDHPGHDPFRRALRALFDSHQQDGHVTFLYRTELFYGTVSPSPAP